MNHFWDRVIAPVVEALRPSTILQIGAKDDRTVPKLIEVANRIGAVIHVAALNPSFDLEAARHDAGDRLIVHRARGLDVVPLLAAPDLILIDDDPNWYTVHSLLTAIDRQVRRSGRPFPTIVLTQTGWPYARRDSYDEPSAIPAAFRQIFEQAGIMPDTVSLSAQNGLFSDRFNAATENEDQNGVLTALENFVADRPGRFVITLLPMFHGLALLHPTRGREDRTLQPVLSSLALGRSATALVSDLEAARVRLEIERKALHEALSRATYRNDALHRALRSEQQGEPTTIALEGPSAATLARALLRRVRRAAAARLRNLAATNAS